MRRLNILKIIISITIISDVVLQLEKPIKLKFRKEESQEYIIIKKLEDVSLSVELTLGTDKKKYRLNLETFLPYNYLIGPNVTKRAGIFEYTSKSYSVLEDTPHKKEKGEFEDAISIVDSAEYGDDLTDGRIIKEGSFVTYLVKEVDEKDFALKSNTGKLGLQNKKTEQGGDEDNFIKQLKLGSKIKRSVFSINYMNDKEGELIIGSLPYDYNPSFSSTDFSECRMYPYNMFGTIKSSSYRKELVWSMAINRIQFGEYVPKKRKFVLKTAYFNFNSGMFQAPRSAHDLIYDLFFKQLVDAKKCKESSLDGYIYYDCAVSGVDYNKMPKLYFINDLSHNVFAFDSNDLFKTVNDRKYFLIKFEEKMTVEDNWILGEIFFKKYSVYFDFDNEKVILKKQEFLNLFLNPKKNLLCLHLFRNQIL